MISSDHRMTATTWVAGLLFIGYLIWGYAQFLDGEFSRKIIEYHALSPVSNDTPKALDPCAVTHYTLKAEYRKGETVTAQVNLTKHRDIEGLVQWNLMDARFYGYAARRGVIPEGTHHLVVEIETLPMHIPPGKYYFKGLVKYQTNIFRDIYVPIKTNDFEVVE